ncbi:MAG TPA: hypothetical protein VMT62_11605, partial [Syntrophorhabdaceae bacterium]|nr:hypothetical protein [Syntrophorhabdaceae bacterium]
HWNPLSFFVQFTNPRPIRYDGSARNRYNRYWQGRANRMLSNSSTAALAVMIAAARKPWLWPSEWPNLRCASRI